MASLARSFKPPSYLSPRRRPAMPGRSISNSSELSLGSSSNANASASANHSGPPDDSSADAASGPATPTLEDRSAPWMPAANETEGSAPTTLSPSRSRCSRPIAIDLPRITRNSSGASVYTPPEPLSARGDLPGGYFPMHEDPLARIHRPHPFQQDAINAHKKSITLAAESVPSHPDLNSPLVWKSSAMTHSNAPVDSYLPAGFHDNPQPMGKYYPSNYEQRHSNNNSQQQLAPTSRPSLTESLASSVKSDSPLLTAQGSSIPKSPTVDAAETRRRMLQYQRDMVAQATLALGNRETAGSGGGPATSGLPLKEARIAAAALQRKPKSPKLAPLGSPGPVTPMELGGSGASYLDKGRTQDRMYRETLAPPGTGYARHSS